MRPICLPGLVVYNTCCSINPRRRTQSDPKVIGDQEQDESELPDEIFGALRLKRKVGGTGYMYVTGLKLFSKKNPYQVRGRAGTTGQTRSELICDIRQRWKQAKVA